MTAANLFDALGMAPALPGARCRGRHDLFDVAAGGPHHDDEDVEYARQAALGLCTTCPALQRCRAWFNSLPTKERPPGVTAGLIEGKQPMTDNHDEQQEFNRESASVALELLELTRLAHHENGIDMIEAFEGLSTDNPLVVLGACLNVVEGAISLGADRQNPAAFDGRLGALRGLVMDTLGGAQ